MYGVLMRLLRFARNDEDNNKKTLQSELKRLYFDKK